MRFLFSTLFLVLFINFGLAQSPAGYTWQEVHTVDFGTGANQFKIEAACGGLGGEVELRLDQNDGQVIGRAYFHHTGDPGYFMEYTFGLEQTVAGSHEVYMNFQDYSEPDSGGVLQIGNFDFILVEEAEVSTAKRLHIYPPVPGLDPSPYYEIFIQKVSDLNAANLKDVTNWETPFAWFSQCPDHVSESTLNYYSAFIGGWSHTYTNFELDPNTPIVVKIRRKTDTGDDAPSGPVLKATVHPAHKVDSLEIIDGDVYLTLSDPALVAVDIDGQMDDRVAPRVSPTGWSGGTFPYNNRKDGSHSVTIFANPFIEDKPNPDDPGVLLVRAGKKIPDNLDEMEWDILYFEPGVHKTSVDTNELGELIERRWEANDMITLQDNKSYYIPGDAIVYGNFTDVFRDNNQSENIRVYGHGTISGNKILHHKHWDDYPDGIYPNEKWHRPLYVTKAKNVHYEGITAEDPAFHTLALESSNSEEYPANTIKWCKVVAWRGNSDALTVGGNVIAEDCFLRTQDDGIYTGGAHTLRRIVFWHDANGSTLRGDFMLRRYSENNAPNIPQDILLEDIDLIYARGVFVTSDTELYGAIGVHGAHSATTLTGGVKNSGQMILFRNIRVSDPNPTRGLFSFDLEDGADDFAGLRFENIDYSGVQSFNWEKNGFLGGPNAVIRNIVFDDVTFNGQKLDQKYVDDHFITDRFFDATFRNDYFISSSNHALTTTVTNGMITVEETGIEGEVIVNANPIEGYRFHSWSGDLNGTDAIDTIYLDSDKAVTANFELITYSITTSAENGTIKLEPQSESYLPGTAVTITALGDLGYGLESWGGDLSGSENPVMITMNSDKTVSATFKEIETCTLTIETKYGTVLLDPPGGEYNPGTSVTLTAENEPAYYFEKWLGDLVGAANPATIVMDSNKTIEARFVYEGYGEVSSAINFGGADYTAADGTIFTGNVSGSSYSTTDAIDGTEDDILYQSERWGNFSVNFPVENGSYEVVLMFAEIYHSSSGSRVFNVSIEGEQVISNLDIYARVGKNSAYNQSHRVEINDGEISIDFQSIVNNAKISAIKIFSNEFNGARYTLTMGNVSNGIVETNPADGPYPAGSNVLITATPNPGYNFDAWGGDLSGSENPSTIYMDADKTIEATFVETNWYSLDISATNGNVTVEPEEGIYGYIEGTIMTLTAFPDPGYVFDGWSGDVTGIENPVSFSMDSNISITANFIEEVYFTLNTESANGSVSLDPPGGTYPAGTIVTLAAIPVNDFVFVEWEGDISGSDNPSTITMDSDKNVTAVFRNPFALHLTVNAVNGSVQITPEQETYYPGSSVIITAIPDEGYEFTVWEGDLTGTSNPAGIVMDKDKTITALFNELTGSFDRATGSGNSFQVYPNPFSEETAIQYSLDLASHAKLSVFNIMGQQLATLVNGYQSAGSYEIIWRPQETIGSADSNGIYFIMLQSGNNMAQVKKVSIIK